MLELAIGHTWDGVPVGDDERAHVRVDRRPDALEVHVDAPFHGDPAPDGPPASTPGLWEHEVVELFVAGPGERYLEVELGPHGHHLVLWLEGIRRPAREGFSIVFEPSIAGSRWRGTARVGAQVPLPETPWRVNAFAIHGVGVARRYLAHTALPGERPDFHQPGRFASWDELAR